MKKEPNCVFCQKKSADFILENNLAAAFWDLHPINPGHLLIIPKNHRSNYFKLTRDELEEINELIFAAKKLLDEKYQPAGYNLLSNNGHYGGQSIMHCHIHVIPRYPNDGLFMPKPRRKN
ncbi:HIT family protein [Xylocopilactobacillus apicola]|uniref:HIT family protein n=1 Tax=Xylocopilactobacillus apicola TaxID=2932184 RepID=A0AAU9DKF5_9LACO|nr:HIT family protein [Xylocopilactobacillus apicola]BDR59026.1 HIT family protein [Xylocopilactobacillus apicola]